MTTMDTTVAVGEEVTLECNVSVVMFLSEEPTIELAGPGGDVVEMATGRTLKYLLDPVNTSHAGQYTCTARLQIPSVGVDVRVENTTNLMVQSESLSSTHVQYLWHK